MRIAHTVRARGRRSPSMGLPAKRPWPSWQGEHRSIGQLEKARESGRHRRTWRLSFLAAAEYRATGKGPPARSCKRCRHIALPCHRSGVGWLALGRQARGVRQWRSSMSALLRDLRVGQWIYADSLGKPGSGGLMGKIICFLWTNDHKVVVVGPEKADDPSHEAARTRLAEAVGINPLAHT